MQTVFSKFITIVAVVIFIAATAEVTPAAAPGLINYQGRLTNAAGTPLSGTYSVQFSVYNVPSGGSPFWAETQSVTTDANGLFSVLLGSVSTSLAIVLDGVTLYLGVKVGTNTELVPRTRLVSTPYALRVYTVDGATGGIVSGTLRSSGNIDCFCPAGQLAISGISEFSSSSANIGVYGGGMSSSYWNVGVWGGAHDANGSTNSAGVYGQGISDFGGQIWAGYFDGWVTVTGDLFAGAKFFKIDDPMDPANRTLQHACVESNEFKNVYDGVVITNTSGLATVTMPSWFETLNKDFRYQLTTIGQFAQAIVSSKISGGSFSIRTDKPNVEVSWQVTGVRKDPYVIAHPFEVEQDKPAPLRGKYLHPREYGVDEKLGVDYAARQHSITTEMLAAERARAADSSSTSPK